MEDKFNIGDYVEVDIGMGLCAIGEIVTEDQYMSALIDQRSSHHQFTLSGQKRSGFHTIPRSTHSSYRIKFLDETTHTALDTELRKLSEKEIFKYKLQGKTKIYEM